MKLLEAKISDCASEKRRCGPGGTARRAGNGDLQLAKAGPHLLPGEVDDVSEPAVDDFSRLQHIQPQVVECIQELSQANEQLREIQMQLAAQATDLQQQLARRSAQVRERLETMDTVRYVLAHVFREPVRSINSFAQLLLAENAAGYNENSKEYLDRVTKAALRLDSLIQDLVEFGGLNQTELPCGNLSLDASVCKVVGDLAGAIALKGAELDIQRELPRVWGHAARLQEVLTRLLDNALKFVAPGVAPRVRIWAEPRSARVRLWIEDNGIGVPDVDHERIFGLFQRLNDSYPGTGVGLAIVRKGMEQMGGEAGVESLSGGSRFWIDLNPAQGTYAEPSHCVRPGPAHEPHNKVLISP